MINLRGFLRLLPCLIKLAAVWSCPAHAQQVPWPALASATNLSPAVAGLYDLTQSWMAPDGRSISLTVLSPHPAANAAIVTMASVPAGSNATPAFIAAVASARSQQAGVLSIPTGTYTFTTLDPSQLGHALLQGLSDITIEGNGSTFIFTQNVDGIYITQSQRIRVQNLSIRYALHMYSLGVGVNNNGTIQLRLSSAYPVTSADQIGHIAAYNPATHLFQTGGLAIYEPANLAYVGNQTYNSTSWTPAMVGLTFVVFHHYYGGIAIHAKDSPASGAVQDQDITLYNVIVNSGPGMGINAYGVARGFAVINSAITPAPGSLIST